MLRDRQGGLGALTARLGHAPELDPARRHERGLRRRQDPVREDEEPQDQQLVRGIRHGRRIMVGISPADAIPRRRAPGPPVDRALDRRDDPRPFRANRPFDESGGCGRVMAMKLVPHSAGRASARRSRRSGAAPGARGRRRLPQARIRPALELQVHRAGIRPPRQPEGAAAHRARSRSRPSVKAWNGKKAIVTGFMLPTKLENGSGKAVEFLLMANQMACCYGTVPNMNDWVIVKIAEGRAHHPGRARYPSAGRSRSARRSRAGT